MTSHWLGVVPPTGTGSWWSDLMNSSLQAVILLAAAVLAGLVAHAIVFGIVRRFAARTDTPIDNTFVGRLSRPALVILPLLAVQFVMPSLTITDAERALLRHVVSLVTILAVVWLVVSLIHAGAAIVKSRHDVSVADNYTARRIHTQVNLLSRTLVVFVVIVGTGLALMTFPRVRELGTSLLASAGIAGIVIGFAARPVLENLIAGVQLALTQPINIDDVVIVEGEWGRIEQITATYVVVKIWDERRLIVPFSKFISEPFQNWTRRTADILGTVFVYADYTVPVEAVRQELQRIAENHDKWDGKVCNLQVTDATPTTVQLRGLVSAGSSGDAWELRVHVREKLIEFLQRDYPEALPRSRVSLHEDGTVPKSTSSSAAAPKPRQQKKKGNSGRSKKTA